VYDSGLLLLEGSRWGEEEEEEEEARDIHGNMRTSQCKQKTMYHHLINKRDPHVTGPDMKAP
jgi:hypothetical protein